VPTDDLGEEPEDECAHLRMRDFHSSICFLCVSGVGWILCACGVGRVRRVGRRRWVGEARREEASWDRGWRAFGSGRAHAMGAC